MAQKDLDRLLCSQDEVRFAIAIEVSRCKIASRRHRGTHGSEGAIAIRQKDVQGTRSAVLVSPLVYQIIALITIDVGNENVLIAGSYEVGNRNGILKRTVSASEKEMRQ